MEWSASTGSPRRFRSVERLISIAFTRGEARLAIIQTPCLRVVGDHGIARARVQAGRRAELRHPRQEPGLPGPAAVGRGRPADVRRAAVDEAAALECGRPRWSRTSCPARPGSRAAGRVAVRVARDPQADDLAIGRDLVAGSAVTMSRPALQRIAFAAPPPPDTVGLFVPTTAPPRAGATMSFAPAGAATSPARRHSTAAGKEPAHSTEGYPACRNRFRVRPCPSSRSNASPGGSAESSRSTRSRSRRIRGDRRPDRPERRGQDDALQRGHAPVPPAVG